MLDDPRDNKKHIILDKFLDILNNTQDIHLLFNEEITITAHLVHLLIGYIHFGIIINYMI